MWYEEFNLSVLKLVRQSSFW